jgi:hypothetical protein
LPDTACSQCSPLCLLQCCTVLPVFRILGTRNAGKHSLAFYSKPFTLARKRPLSFTSELLATIAASSAHRRPLPNAARSVHYDVLKTSTLEMIPTDRCPRCRITRSTLRTWPPRAIFLPSPLPTHLLLPRLLTLSPLVSFVLHYADTTELRGFQCKDHVKFGRVTGDLAFACLYHCNSPDFNDSDGILGFGRYVNDVRLPAPLFTSLTDPSNLLPGSPQLSPKFRSARDATRGPLVLLQRTLALKFRC